MTATLQQASQQISESVDSLKGIADSMTEFNTYNKKMNMYDRGSNAERSRSGADPNVTFKLKVYDYYGQTMCMITGENNVRGAHLVPDSAKPSEFSDLTIGYESDFAVGNARNGLLLIDILEDGMDRSEIYFLMNPLTHRIQLFSRVKRFMEYNGMYLIYLNDNALPYRRVLKDKFDTIKAMVAKKGGTLATVNNATPFETVAELSDKESQNDANTNDGDNTQENEVKTEAQVNYDLDAGWFCGCQRRNDGFEHYCRRCQQRRVFTTLNTDENRRKWAKKAVDYYGRDILKYWHLLPLVRQYYEDLPKKLKAKKYRPKPNPTH